MFCFELVVDGRIVSGYGRWMIVSASDGGLLVLASAAAAAVAQ